MAAMTVRVRLPRGWEGRGILRVHELAFSSQEFLSREQVISGWHARRESVKSSYSSSTSSWVWFSWWPSCLCPQAANRLPKSRGGLNAELNAEQGTTV